MSAGSRSKYRSMPTMGAGNEIKNVGYAVQKIRAYWGKPVKIIIFSIFAQRKKEACGARNTDWMLHTTQMKGLSI